MRLDLSALTYWHWMIKGSTLQKLKRYEETVEAYDRVVEVQPNSYRAWAYRGLALLALNREEEASISFLRALEANAEYYKAKSWLYSYLQTKTEVWKEVRDTHKALQAEYGSIGASSIVSERYEQASNPQIQAQLEQALGLQRKVVQVDPTASNWLDYAALLDWAGQAEEALDACDKVIQIEPKSFGGWLRKAELLKELQRYEEAIDCFYKVLEISALYTTAWEHIGDMLEKLQRHEEAVAAYQEGVLQTRGLISGTIQKLSIKERRSIEKCDYVIIGRLLEKLNQYDEAITTYRRAREVIPKEYLDSYAWLREADLLEKLGRHKEFSALWDEWLKSVETPEQKSQVLLFKSNKLGQQGHHEEAIAALDQYVEVDPNSADAWARRGDALCKLKRFEDAIESYDRAFGLDPSVGYIAEKREHVLEQLKQSSEKDQLG